MAVFMFEANVKLTELYSDRRCILTQNEEVAIPSEMQ
jgi:hypothetical protein